MYKQIFTKPKIDLQAVNNKTANGGTKHTDEQPVPRVFSSCV